MNESNACTPSEPPYSRVILKRMEQGNDGLRALVSKLTSKMDTVWGSQPSELSNAKTSDPPIGCIMDEFDMCLNTQAQLLERLSAEIARLSRFF